MDPKTRQNSSIVSIIPATIFIAKQSIMLARKMSRFCGKRTIAYKNIQYIKHYYRYYTTCLIVSFINRSDMKTAVVCFKTRVKYLRDRLKL